MTKGINRKQGAARIVLLMITVLVSVTVFGCKKEEEKDKLADLEFTVVSEAELPEELKKLIDEKKANEFKLSYSADGSLYIAVGYGEQKTGGYSISVKALYLTENAIVMDTDLTGPAQGEEVSRAPSYPYIVVRTEDRPESIVFR